MASTVDPSALAAFRRTERVLDALPRAIVVTDRHGVIIGWNRIAETLYGWPADRVIGSHVSDVVRPTTESQTRSAILRAAVGGETWSGDFSVLRRDGSPLRVFAIVAPLRDEDGTVVGTVAAADDVTDQRLAEQRGADLFQHLQLALEAGISGRGAGTW